MYAAFRSSSECESEVLTAVASLGWVTPGAATEGVTALFFPEKPGDLFLVASSAVSPLISSSQKLTTFFCSSLYRFLLLSLGCHPPPGCHPTPHMRFSTIPCKFAHKKFFLRVSPPGGCHPGRSAPPHLVTPLINRVYCECDAVVVMLRCTRHCFMDNVYYCMATECIQFRRRKVRLAVNKRLIYDCTYVCVCVSFLYGEGLFWFSIPKYRNTVLW